MKGSLAIREGIDVFDDVRSANFLCATDASTDLFVCGSGCSQCFRGRACLADFRRRPANRLHGVSVEIPAHAIEVEKHPPTLPSRSAEMNHPDETGGFKVVAKASG